MVFIKTVIHMNSEKTNLTKHCELCLNHSINLKNGIFCILTNEKPNFDTKCNEIKFGKILKERITNINVEYKKLEIERIWVYSYFTTFLILGIGVILLTYLFYEYISEILKMNIGKSTVLLIGSTTVFISIGIVLLSYAFGMLNRHLLDKKSNLKNKKELDSILELYNIKYEINIEIKDRILKQSQMKTDLKIIKN